MALGKKLSVADFKKHFNVEQIDIVKSPITDKLFVTGNGTTLGAVSTKWKQGEESKFVEIINDETGEILWCLYNKHTENIVATL